VGTQPRLDELTNPRRIQRRQLTSPGSADVSDGGVPMPLRPRTVLEHVASAKWVRPSIRARTSSADMGPGHTVLAALRLPPAPDVPLSRDTPDSVEVISRRSASSQGTRGAECSDDAVAVLTSLESDSARA